MNTLVFVSRAAETGSAQLRGVRFAGKEPEGDGREALWLAKGDLTCKRKSRTQRAH